MSSAFTRGPGIVFPPRAGAPGLRPNHEERGGLLPNGDAALDGLADHPLLSAEDEIALGRQIAAGAAARVELDRGDAPPAERAALEAQIADGDRARAELVRCNQRLVMGVAAAFVGRGLPYEDLLQEGNLGLLAAAEKFDYLRGLRFSTMATWWIRQAMGRACLNSGRMIRLPVHVSEKLAVLNEARRCLAIAAEREPTAEELAAATGFAVARVRQLLDLPGTISMATPVGTEGEITLGDTLRGDADTLNAVEQRAIAGDLRRLLATLDPRERRVLELRYGLDGAAHTLEAIGHALGVTRERARQIEVGALAALRRRVADEPAWQELREACF